MQCQVVLNILRMVNRNPFAAVTEERANNPRALCGTLDHLLHKEGPASTV